MSGPATAFTVDFSNFEEKKVSAHLPEGKYLVRIADVSLTEIKSGENAGGPMAVYELVVADGPLKGSVLIDRFPLVGKALFRTALLYRALGISIEKKTMTIPFRQLLNRTLVVRVEDGDEYKGAIKSEIREYFPAGVWTATAAKEEKVEDNATNTDQDEADDSTSPETPTSASEDADIPFDTEVSL